MTVCWSRGSNPVERMVHLTATSASRTRTSRRRSSVGGVVDDDDDDDDDVQLALATTSRVTSFESMLGVFISRTTCTCDYTLMGVELILLGCQVDLTSKFISSYLHTMRKHLEDITE